MLQRLLILLITTLINVISINAVTSSSALPPDGEAMENLRLADAAYGRGDNISALHYCHEFIRLTGDMPSSAPLDSAYSTCYHILGNIHFYYFDYGKAIRHYNTSLKFSRKLNDTDRAARLLANIAMSACYLQDQKLADRYFAQADSTPMNNPDLDRFVRKVRSALYNKTFGDRTKSIPLMKEAYYILAASKNVSRRFLLTPISEIFQMHEQNGQSDSALLWLGKYAELSKEYNVASMMADVERGYMCIYARMPGMHDKMLEHLDRYFAYKDSLLDNEAFLRISEQYEENLSRRNNDKIKTLQIKVTKLEAILLGVILIVCVAIGIFLWVRNSRRLRKADGVIFESNREMTNMVRRDDKQLKKYTDPNLSISTDTSISNHDTDPLPLDSDSYSASHTATGANPTDNDNNTADSSEDEDNLEEEQDENGRQIRRGLSSQASDELADKIAKVMETSEEWLDPDFSISSLAALVGTNAKYVSACINDRYGKNFRTFINEYRILTALRRMSDTPAYGQFTIGAIGESVGFRSSTNFIAAFRKVTGVTPSKYLQLAKK